MDDKLEYIKYLENTVTVLVQSINKWKEIYKNYDIDKILEMEEENNKIKEENNKMKEGIEKRDQYIFILENDIEILETRLIIEEGKKIIKEGENISDKIKMEYKEELYDNKKLK
jgi:hypothetical protein